MSNPWSFSPSWSLAQPQRQFTQPAAQNLWTIAQMPGARRIDKVSPTLRDPFERMMRDAPESVRRELSMTDSFRTYAEQADLKRRKPHLAAHPGHSRHELGEAFDLGYASDATKQWVHANAGRYGLGFPMVHEPWHIEPLTARGPGTVGNALQQANASPGAGTPGASNAPTPPPDLPSIAGMTSPFDTPTDDSLGGALAQAATPADDGLAEAARTVDPAAYLTDPRIPKLTEVLTAANAEQAAPATPVLDETSPLFNIKNIGQAKQFKPRRIT
jgi:hypothetical protein